MDGDSVVKVGAYRKAWVKETYGKPEETDSYPKKAYNGAKLLYYYNCEIGTSVPVQKVLYADQGATGDVVESRSVKFKAENMIEVVPDSVGEALLRAACGTPKYRASLHKSLSAE